MLQEIQVRGGLKNDPIRQGGGGWIFSGITQLKLHSRSHIRVSVTPLTVKRKFNSF